MVVAQFDEMSNKRTPAPSRSTRSTANRLATLEQRRLATARRTPPANRELRGLLGFENHRRRNVFSPVDEETQEDNRQHDQYDENDESDQDLDQDNDGRNGFDDFNDHDSNDEGESHSPHRYTSARFKDNDIYDEGESRPSRRYVSAQSKRTDYRENVKLVSGLLQGLPSIPDPPTADSTRKYVEDHENAVSYDASYDGFLGHKTFHNMFKRGLGNGTSRKLYDDINHRPHIKELWDAAEAQDRAYMQDLAVSTPAGTPPIAPGNFATHYWPAFKAEFLGLDRTPWYDTHYSKFSLKGQEQGKDTVSKYYETKFISQVNKQLSTQDCHTVTHHGPRPIASTLPMYSSPT